MDESCCNCGKTVNENFCAYCGQKKYSRIDKKYILNELENTIFQTNKGFLFSIKNIIKNPGKTAKSFIDGSRVNHYKPILLAFLLSGISAFISFKIIGFKELMEEYYSKQNMSSPLMIDILSFTTSYNSLIMLSFIPFLAIITKLAFRKWGQNYYEHIVMNAFILSVYTIINIIIIYPIMFFLKIDASLVIQISSLSIFTVPLIMVWFFKGFYKEKPFKSIMSRVLLILLLFFLSFVVLMIVFAIGGFIFAFIKGPEALEYIKPQ
ncbi:DUF3667 domain-containing protein [Mesonia aestuariivivens]|uniref:DUF3667 domain-containing protein n=1 Tax=Mesonia aestuariivivens TaxID=2796128 RepID=A0ABS6VYL5_9FLAO|nr:DUF3667 domain-containing protein [Mesonia aestuariivivens]MBW2960680.1 DUF3667 domain-containing protein [Mesonia aestuariivivens]